ncbi:MAG: hypothetical protein CME19_19580 [Gemmatimonadetes bacterium]|nr:hypothetical protein [Gemmatimonadota bacterium]
MPFLLSDDQIAELLSTEDFVYSCDQAFKLYGEGALRNLQRDESVTRDGDKEVFRLELAGLWEGRLRGRKLIVEHSDVSTGRLGERMATIELVLEGTDQPFELGAELITNRRTGAAAVLGAHYLGPSCPEVVGVLGTGRIAESVVLAADAKLKPSVIYVTSRSGERREAFVAKMGEQVETDVIAVDSIPRAVLDADVIIAAVPTPEPILSSEMIKPRAHVSVVAGDPRTAQVDIDLLTSRDVVVDAWDQATASGDFVRSADRIDEFRILKVDREPATIGDAAKGRLLTYQGGGCVTYFTGMAIQDLHAAYTAVQKVAVDT